MTTAELKIRLDDDFGHNQYPEVYRVDADTYAHVCYELFGKSTRILFPNTGRGISEILVGRHKGPMFKGVELILMESV